MRVQQPKEYKHGEDFSTFSYRYKIYAASAGVPDNMIANLLLNNVDDTTMQKLAPVIEGLTDREKRNIDTVLTKCRDTLYPQSDVRALRQQLTSGSVIQADDDDVEAYASKLRSIANMAAYHNTEERSEACLNAFLHGVKPNVYDKLVTAPGAENDFETAVAAARKFEKMSKARTLTVPETYPVFKVNSTQPEHHNTRGQHDSHHEQAPRPRYMPRGQREVLPDQDSEVRSPGRGRSNGFTPFRGQNRSRRVENRRCFRCHVVGHIAANCTANNDLN